MINYWWPCKEEDASMNAFNAGTLVAALILNAGNAFGREAGAGWTPEEWAACKDGSEMIKALESQVGWPGDEKRRPLVIAVCECARLALPYLPKDDTRARQAIDAVEKEAREKEWSVNAARYAFSDLMDAVPYLNAPAGGSVRVIASAYVSAAYAAASATIDYAEDAVEAAAYSVERAADAAESATRNPDDGGRIRARCADIIRSHFPKPPEGPGK